MSTTSQPAVFISHGSPMVALEQGDYQKDLGAFGATLKPAAILVVSAHWNSAESIHITSGEANSLIYDFGGFPSELYQLRYDAPGLPSLAARVAETLRAKQFDVTLDPQRGLDHGAWIPLRLMFPAADIPVVELSIPTSFSPQRLFELGRQLAPLRDEGVLLFGSGGIVHNLREVDFRSQHGAPVAWAAEFDHWFADALARRDYEQLFAYEKVAHSQRAVPTPEHFVPVFVVLGAAQTSKALENIYEGFEYGTLSMRSFVLR